MNEGFGHSFRDPALLQQALRHRSVGAVHNERMEFLGDALVNLIVAEALHDRWPKADEGALTRARASLVAPRAPDHLQEQLCLRSRSTEQRARPLTQMRRAAVSIGSNIAEGCGRGTRKEMGYFIRIALGSSQELRYQFLLGRDLGWIPAEDHVQLEVGIDEVRAMLHALHRGLSGGSKR